MAKILLVEDDQNLREIFEMRLQAEGYQTLTAGDGDEALVVAMKEKPDLIIADVMMPKLSGFEMLETLRAAPEMTDTKVVMMTALGQAEDRARGEKLGVVKYLVKSQVTLEDFVRVVREVLQPNQADAAAPAASATDSGQANPMPTNNQQGATSMDDQTQSGQPAGMPGADSGAAPAGGDSGMGSGGAMPTDKAQDEVNKQVDDWAASAPSTPPAGGDTSGGDSGSMGPADGSAGGAPTPPTDTGGDASSSGMPKEDSGMPGSGAPTAS